MAKQKVRTAADLLGAPPAPKRRGPKPGAPNAGRPPLLARERLNEAQAQLAEVRAAKLAGDLVLAADAEATMAKMCAEIRAAMLAVPDRVGARLGDLTATHIRVIDEEIRAALTALGSR